MKKITYSFYVGGEKVDKLTEEQKDKMAEAFGQGLSDYYTAHPDEYVKLCENSKLLRAE